MRYIFNSWMVYSFSPQSSSQFSNNLINSCSRPDRNIGIERSSFWTKWSKNLILCLFIQHL